VKKQKFLTHAGEQTQATARREEKKRLARTTPQSKGSFTGKKTTIFQEERR
jgi:hypothetical protein